MTHLSETDTSQAGHLSMRDTASRWPHLYDTDRSLDLLKHFSEFQISLKQGNKSHLR